METVAQLNNYQKYTKPRLENDANYRVKWNGYINRYRQKRYKEDKDFKENEQKRQRDLKREQYHNNEDYRAKKREDALNRYYEKKALNFYINLFI